MAVPEARGFHGLLAALALAVPLTLACAHGGTTQEPPPLPPPAPPAAPPVPQPRRTAPPPPPPAPILVEIDPEGDDESGDHRSLVEASRAARARRDAGKTGSRKPLAVINDENLGDYAKAGELTFAEGEAVPEAPTAGAPEEGSGVEDYWRDQAAELRDQWSRVVEERQETEDRAALLRRRFYAEDDPFVRDGQIKPEWDQSLERLAELRRDEEALRLQLDELYAEGALAGADPEWLAEVEALEDGGEESPEEEALETGAELQSHEVQDPPY